MDVTQIIAYEQGELEGEEVLELFQDLVNSGMAWQLQGHYGRTAKYLIEEGYIFDPEHAEDVNPGWNDHLEGR